MHGYFCIPTTFRLPQHVLSIPIPVCKPSHTYPALPSLFFVSWILEDVSQELDPPQNLFGVVLTFRILGVAPDLPQYIRIYIYMY